MIFKNRFMHKKIMLYLVSLAVILAIFFAFRGNLFNSGPGAVRRHAKPIPMAGGLGGSNLVIQTRNAQGALLYVLRARRAVPQRGGRYQLQNPEMQFYSANGQSIMVASEHGGVVVNQIGGPLSNKLYLSRGTLRGHPTITLGPLATFVAGSTTRRRGQIQMSLTAPLKFNYQEGLLTSHGVVRVRGDHLFFKGADLTAEFNVKTKQLEYLQIARGRRLVLTNVGGAAGLAGRSPPPQRATSPGSATTQSVATEPAVAPQPVVYRLLFGRHVQAVLGAKSLQSSRLGILFTAGVLGAGGNPGKAGPAKQPAAMSTNRNISPASRSGRPPATRPVAAHPLKAATGPQHTLVVTWVGSLVVKPLAGRRERLLGPSDVIFRAIGRAGRPVVMHDGPDRIGTASVVRYETGNQQLMMRATGLAPLTFTDKKIGRITCRNLRYSNLTHRLALGGPGHLRVAAAALGKNNKVSWTGSWLKNLRLVLSPTVRQTGGRTARLALRRVRMTGKARLKSKGLKIAAARLEAAIVGTSNPRQRQALSSFGAQGDVRITSWSDGRIHPPDQLRCDSLELLTAPSKNSSRIEPNRLVADGAVRVVFHQPARGAGHRAATYILRAAHLRAGLTRDRHGGSATGKRMKAAPPASPGRYRVTSFHAWKNMNLHIMQGGRPIVATGYSLAGNRGAGTAVLSADPAGGLWPVLAQAGDHITGQRIFLAKKGRSLNIRGPGRLIMQTSVAGIGPKSPAIPAGGTPQGNRRATMVLTWERRMSFSGTRRRADFHGRVRVKLSGRPRRQSQLTCPELTIHLYRKPHASSLHLARLTAAITHAGSAVVARDASYNKAGLLRTRLYLRCSRLRYNAINGLLRIPDPGKMVLEDYAGTAPGAAKIQSAAKLAPGHGQSAFSWRHSLEYHARTAIVAMNGHVRLVFRPMTPLKSLAPSAPGRHKPGQNSGLVLLDCRQLMAQLTQPGGGKNTGMEMGLGGPRRLALVQAQNAALELMGIRLEADVLRFNARKRLATASGRNGQYAIINDASGRVHGAARKIIWNLARGRGGVKFIQPRGVVSTP